MPGNGQPALDLASRRALLDAELAALTEDALKEDTAWLAEHAMKLREDLGLPPFIGDITSTRNPPDGDSLDKAAPIRQEGVTRLRLRGSGRKVIVALAGVITVAVVVAFWATAIGSDRGATRRW